MQIERFDAMAATRSVRACYEVYLAGAQVDDPAVPPMPFRSFAGWLALGWTEDPLETWLARTESGTVIGWYVIALPQRENRHLAALNLVVHPSRRRAGLGTTLLRHAAARARQASRTVLTGDAWEDGAGPLFARAMGARAGLAEIRRVLELGSVTDELRAAADPGAIGYRPLSWEGPAPQQHLARVVAVNLATVDMPRDAGHEAQLWDAGRVRQDELRRETQGLRCYTVAAMSQATGELAGLTQVVVDPELTEWGFQSLTAVTRPHRGRKVGLMVKLAMLDLLADREPRLKRILTGNADGNEHMIAINAKLGFQVLDRWQSFELPADGTTVSGPAH